MVKRVEIRIYGRVQGVFFRQETKQKAEKLGLAGFVRNEPDSSVSAVAEGEEQRLKEFVAWCGTGPQLAEVSGVEVNWQEPEGLRHGFSITG